jgi:hypothetical protein
MLVTGASHHQVVRREEAIAVAGNKSLMYDLTVGLRHELGADALNTHVGVGYQLTPAAAERVAAFMDSTEFVDRIILPHSKRRAKEEIQGQAVPAAQRRVPAKRQKQAAVTFHAAECPTASTALASAAEASEARLGAECLLDDIFASDQDASDRATTLPQGRPASRLASGSIVYFDGMQRREHAAAMLGILLAGARQHQMVRTPEILKLAGKRSLMHEVIKWLRTEFGYDAVKTHHGIGYELTPAVAQRVAALLDSTEVVNLIAQTQRAARESKARVPGGSGSAAASCADARLSAECFLDDIFASRHPAGGNASALLQTEPVAIPVGLTQPRSVDRKKRMDAVIRELVAHARQSKALDRHRGIALAGSVARLDEVIRGLREEFGSHAVKSHFSLGYQLAPAVAERIAALGDLTDLVERVAGTEARHLAQRKARAAALSARVMPD